jgi:hypothetical protein
MGTRPRLGLSPNTPQWLAGMRIEPPPSLAWATGTMPAATAAAEPPDEPPALWAGFQGLRVAPCRRDSVVAVWPNSGEVNLAKMLSPAAW